MSKVSYTIQIYCICKNKIAFFVIVNAETVVGTNPLALTNKNDEEMNQAVPDANAPDQVDETNTDDETDETETVGISNVEKKQRWKKRRMNADKLAHHHRHHKGSHFNTTSRKTVAYVLF